MRKLLLIYLVAVIATFVLLKWAVPALGYFTPTTTPVQEHNILKWLPVAEQYWHEPPPCGIPNITYAYDDPQIALGWASWDNCTIYINVNADVTRTLFSWDICILILHEYGHLVLGPTYFATTNPTDPTHSTDPSNIMYYQITSTIPLVCITKIRSKHVLKRRSLSSRHSL